MAKTHYHITEKSISGIIHSHEITDRCEAADWMNGRITSAAIVGWTIKTAFAGYDLTPAFTLARTANGVDETATLEVTVVYGRRDECGICNFLEPVSIASARATIVAR